MEHAHLRKENYTLCCKMLLANAIAMTQSYVFYSNLTKRLFYDIVEVVVSIRQELLHRRDIRIQPFRLVTSEFLHYFRKALLSIRRFTMTLLRTICECPSILVFARLDFRSAGPPFREDDIG